MRCACGYVYREDWEIKRDSDWGTDRALFDELAAMNGHFEFIKIEGSFSKCLDYGRLEEVYLYACPICGAVQMKL
jgi:hypothetical protein